MSDTGFHNCPKFEPDVFPSREQALLGDLGALSRAVEESIAVLRLVHDNVLLDRDVEATLNEINMQIWRFQIALNYSREASRMSALGQDPQGLEAKPASPTAESGDAHD